MGTTYTLTGNLRDVIPGGVSTVHAAYIRTNLPDGAALIDTTVDGGIAPSNTGRIPLTGNTFSLELLGTTNTGLNVVAGTLRYEVVVEFGKPGKKGLFAWSSGFFPLTANADLKDIVGELELVPPSTRADQLAARIDGVEDHGNVSGSLVLNPANGYHVFDATGPTTVELGTPPGYSIAFKAITGAADVTVDGLPDLELSDDQWATFVYYRDAWHLAAAGASGGGTVEPVTDPPTQPGVITVDPTADGFNLTAVPSTVAAGYKWSIDGSPYNLDSGPSPSMVHTGLEPSSVHSGGVKAYNSLGELSTARLWGPASVDAMALHDYILSLDPILYVRMSQGAWEDFSPDGQVWSPWNGMSFPAFDGPPLATGDAGSARITTGVQVRRPHNNLFVGRGAFTSIFVAGTSLGAVGPTGVARTNLHYGNSPKLGGYLVDGSETYLPSQPGGVHTFYNVRNAGSISAAKYLDILGDITPDGNDFLGLTDPIGAAEDPYLFFNGSPFGAPSNAGFLSAMVIVPYAMTTAQMEAFSTVAGTLNNPKGGTLP